MISLLGILYFFSIVGDILYDTILLGKHNLEKIVLMHDALGNKGTPGKQMVGCSHEKCVCPHSLSELIATTHPKLSVGGKTNLELNNCSHTAKVKNKKGSEISPHDFMSL